MIDKDTETLLICSFRYALGRCTYVSIEVPEIIKRHKEHLAPWVIEQFIRDIDTAIKSHEAGDLCDVAQWLEFRDWLNSML